MTFNAKTTRVGIVRNRDGISLLELKPGGEWSTPLRRNSDNTFVTISSYASDGTEIDIGGVLFRVELSADSRTYELLRLESGRLEDRWAPSGIEGQCEEYDGVTLAPLPALTVRVNTRSGKADLYAESRNVGSELRTAVTKGFRDRTISIRAGSGGVMIGGLMRSDANPLFDDINNNAVSDAIERHANNGSVLSDSPAERQAFAVYLVWREVEKNDRAMFPMPRLRPDRIAVNRALRAGEARK